jgi:hypothetical protein
LKTFFIRNRKKEVKKSLFEEKFKKFVLILRLKEKARYGLPAKLYESAVFL